MIITIFLTVLITIWVIGVVLQFLLYAFFPKLIECLVRGVFPEEFLRDALEESFKEMKEDLEKEAWTVRDVLEILFWPVIVIDSVFHYFRKKHL